MKFLNWLWGSGKPSFRPDTADRETLDVSRALTPKKVDAIMRAANSGDIKDQCRLAAELLEHNIEIAQAVSTRVNAVLGCHWSFEPGNDTPEAKRAAEALSEEIRNIDTADGADNFDELLEDMMGALIPGFAVSEILWENGGHIRGFNSIEQWHFTLVDGYSPRLITDQHPSGLVIPPEAVIYTRFRFHGKDPARGGLIRPLAWIHCFNNGTEKNLLAFLERYGMPFLTAKVDESTWQREKNKIKELIKNFGSSGGGIFSKNTELELLQAANSDGNIYFRMKEYLANAVNQLLLGQTASSGDSAGLSGGDAQSRVRQDILESDCRRLMRTVNAQLCVPWTRFNLGSGIAAPRFVLDYAAPEDKLATAQTLQALAGAGLEADPEEMSERFGMKLTRRATDSYGAQGGNGIFVDTHQTALADRTPAPESAGLSKALEEWLGPEAAAIRDLAEGEELDDKEFGEKLAALAGEFHGDSSKMEKLDAENMKAAHDGRN